MKVGDGGGGGGLDAVDFFEEGFDFVYEAFELEFPGGGVGDGEGRRDWAVGKVRVDIVGGAGEGQGWGWRSGRGAGRGERWGEGVAVGVPTGELDRREGGMFSVMRRAERRGG